MIKIHATRDSVAMGDDNFAPHFAEFQLSTKTTFRQFFNAIKRERYLAQVCSKNHCWMIKIDDLTLGVLVGNSPFPEDENLLSKRLVDYCENNEISVHFSYFSGRDITIHRN